MCSRTLPAAAPQNCEWLLVAKESRLLDLLNGYDIAIENFTRVTVQYCLSDPDSVQWIGTDRTRLDWDSVSRNGRRGVDFEHLVVADLGVLQRFATRLVEEVNELFRER